MRRQWFEVVLIAACLAGCKRSPKSLCEHISKISPAPASTIQTNRCITELALAKTSKPAYYDCLAPCTGKAVDLGDLEDCKVACGGVTETPGSLCRRLLELKGGSSSNREFSECASRYGALQRESQEKFECASRCVRKASSRSEVESCLSECRL